MVTLMGTILDGTALVAAVFAINALGCAHWRCVAHEALTRSGWHLHSLTTTDIKTICGPPLERTVAVDGHYDSLHILSVHPRHSFWPTL